MRTRTVYLIKNSLLLAAITSLAFQPAAWCELEAKYSQTIDTKYGADTKYTEDGKHKSGPGETHKVEEDELILAPNQFSFGPKENQVIYDFAKKEMYLLNPSKHEYAATDMHALVYFFVSEYQNRKFINGALNAAGAKMGASNSALGIQSVFSMVLPQDTDAADTIKQTQDGGTQKFSTDGQEIGSFSASTQPVDQALRKSYAHFLAYTCHVHPKIRHIVADNANLLQELKYKHFDGAAEDSHIVLKLENAGASKGASLAIPDGYTRAEVQSLKPVYEALTKVGHHPIFPSNSVATAWAENSLKKGKVLDALLGSLEYGLMTGERSVSTEFIKAHRQEIQGNRECELFFSALSPPANKEQAEQAAKDLAGISRTGLQKSNVIDIMQANALNTAGHSAEAEKLMIAAIAKNPLVVGAYVDLGQMLASQYHTPEAWEVFRLARELKPDHPMLARVASLDLKLETDFPDFF